jgi:transposase-like protein
MTKGKRKADIIELKELLAQDEDFLRVAVQASVQAALEAEMTQTIGAEKGERTETPYRSGYLHALTNNPGRHVGAAGAAGPRRTVFN